MAAIQLCSIAMPTEFIEKKNPATDAFFLVAFCSILILN
jgi:hypothetical protein